MKKIGLVGGISPASTVLYYRELISQAQSMIGKNNYPEIVIDSVNMSIHDAAFMAENYEKLTEYLLDSLTNLKAAGAQIAAITANSEHIVWDRICNQLPLATVSIVEAVMEEILLRNYERVLILGTEWTMKSRLYEKALTEIGRVPISPTFKDQKTIGEIIYPNLENGIIVEADKLQLLKMVELYCEQYQADAVILGCTELPLMIGQNDIITPILDSTQLHIQKIIEASMEDTFERDSL